MSFSMVIRAIWSNPGNKSKRGRKLRDALRWQVHKRLRRTPRLLRLASGVRFKAYPDCIVSSSLIYTDWPEYYELQFLREFLQEGQLIIDVGANVGHVSLLLSDVVGPDKIMAFEPTPVTFRRLTENWSLNGWPTSNLFHVAVGAQTGSVRMANPNTPDTTNRVVGDASGFEVPLVRLDDYEHLWHDPSVGLLKIDVEGYEQQVFEGGEQLLRKKRPSLIMFESLASQVEPSIAAALSQADYAIFQLDENGEPDFSRQSAQNLFAVPNERRNQFGKAKSTGMQ